MHNNIHTVIPLAPTNRERPERDILIVSAGDQGEYSSPTDFAVNIARIHCGINGSIHFQSPTSDGIAFLIRAVCGRTVDPAYADGRLGCLTNEYFKPQLVDELLKIASNGPQCQSFIIDDLGMPEHLNLAKIPNDILRLRDVPDRFPPMAITRIILPSFFRTTDL